MSVHIVTYNSEQFIETCLAGVYRQTYQLERIIIVDNASTDATVDILAKHGPRVELIKNASNVGFAEAHNLAIRRSQADYYLVLNPDVYLEPEYIQEIIRHMENNPDIGSASGQLCRFGTDNDVDSVGIAITKSRRAYDRTDIGYHAPGIPGEVFGVSAAAAVYRRKMAEEITVNGEFYDQQFFAYKEDVDVAWRSRLAGWQAYYVPSATAKHERGWKRTERRRQSRTIRQYSYINRYRMMFKNENIWYVCRDVFHIAPYEIGLLFYSLVREPFLIASWLTFIQDIPVLFWKRRTVQKLRKVSWQDLYRYFV